MGVQFRSTASITGVATATINACRFVKFSGTSVSSSPGVLQSAAGEQSCGVARFGAASTEKVTVDTDGTATVEAGAAVAIGDTVKADASGRAITWVTSGSKLGVALEAAGAAGQFIEVQLQPNVA